MGMRLVEYFWKFIDDDGSNAEKIKEKAVDKIMKNNLFLIPNKYTLFIESCFKFDGYAHNKESNSWNINFLEDPLTILLFPMFFYNKRVPYRKQLW